MSIRSGQTLKPSEYVRRRSTKMKASRLTVYDIEGVTEIRIVPKEQGKAVRRVSFRAERGDVIIECWDEKTLKLCPANRYGVHCAHVAAAIKLLLKKGRNRNESTAIQEQ